MASAPLRHLPVIISVLVPGCDAQPQTASPPDVRVPTARVSPEEEAETVAPPPKEVTRDLGPRVRTPVAPPPQFADPARREKIASHVPALQAYLDDYFKTSAIVGMSFGLVVDDELAFSSAFGVRNTSTGAPVEVDSVFRIGSITKVFTAMALLQLRDAGQLHLDEPAAQHLPELASLSYPSTDARAMTIRELLTHSSGLPRLGDWNYATPERGPDADEILRSLSGFSLTRAPGVHRLYSNMGFSLLGLVAGAVAGQPYRDLVTAEIFRPLGMTSSVWDDRDVPVDKLATAHTRRGDEAIPLAHWKLGASEGAGGIYSNIPDLAEFAKWQLAAWPARSDVDASPLARASIRESHTMSRFDHLRIDAGGEQTSAIAQGGGLGWVVRHDCNFEHLVWHNGGTEGHHASLYMLPARGVAAIVLANDVRANTDKVALDILEILSKSGDLPARSPLPSPELLAAADAVAQFTHGVDPQVFERVASASIRQHLSAEGAAQFLQWYTERVGTCRVDGATSLETAYAGRFRLKCERGELEIEVHLSPTEGGGIDGLQITQLGAPARAPVREAAASVLKLRRRWDPKRFEMTFGPAFDAHGIRDFLAESRSTLGRCSLASVASIMPNAATFNLSCKKRDATMFVQLAPPSGDDGPRNAKIQGFRIQIDPAINGHCR